MSFYTHTNYLQYRTLVLNRLMDGGAPALSGSPANIRYSDTELKRLSLETFRTWNATAWAVRDRGQFPTNANQVFYDLPANLVGGSITLNANPLVQSNILGYTLLDQDLLQDIQIALMEPISASSWTGSEQFTLQDVQDALEKVRNKFLFESGLVVTHSTAAANPPGDGRFGLADNIVHIRRVAYQPNFPANSPFVPLFRSDEWASDAFNAGWQTTPDTPLEYSIIDSPKVRIQLLPPPALVGNLDILAVQTPSNLNLATGVLLNIPDDLAWVVKYGALADLLMRSGEATDAARAAYCQQRYDQGVGIARRWNTIQQPAINGISLLTSSIQEMDLFSYAWQTSAGTGQPTDFITISPNLIALSPIPDVNGPYSVQLDVLRNFPIPSADTDFIQVGREELNTLVGYTVHLATFKEGGQEFAETFPLAQNMLTLAKQYNGTLAAEAPDLFKIARQSITLAAQKPTGVEMAA